MSSTGPERTPPEASYNCLGQRLGRKGMETRERMLQAALDILDQPSDAPITLSSVASRASVGLTTLYLYFPDIGDLVLAALRRLMETSGEAFLERLRTRWPDDGLEAACVDFLRAHFRFWRRHARILHLRNSLADAGDVRFIEYRNCVSLPLITYLVQQLEGDDAVIDSPLHQMATVMLIGFERLATVATAAHYRQSAGYEQVNDTDDHIDRLLCAEARMMALAVRDQRDACCGRLTSA